MAIIEDDNGNDDAHMQDPLKNLTVKKVRYTI